MNVKLSKYINRVRTIELISDKLQKSRIACEERKEINLNIQSKILMFFAEILPIVFFMIGWKTRHTVIKSSPESKNTAPASDSSKSPNTLGAIKPYSDPGGATINGLCWKEKKLNS